MPEFEEDRSWLLDVSCKGLELTSKKLWLATDIIAMHVCYGKVPTNHFRHKANNITLGCFSGGDLAQRPEILRFPGPSGAKL